MIPDQVSQAELGAYIDGELDLTDQLRVETYLARHPSASAQLMEDLRIRTSLRLCAKTAGPVCRISPSASKRVRPDLDLPPARKGLFRGAAKLAVGLSAMVGVCIVALPSGTVFASTPGYVSDALMAHRTGLIRAGMASQLESTNLNSQEILRSVRIRIPKLPHAWVVTDVQIFPSDEGPALQIMIRTPDRNEVSIFAVQKASSAPVSPVAVRRGQESVAYWRNRDMSYALVGSEPPEALDLAAEDLADERT